MRAVPDPAEREELSRLLVQTGRGDRNAFTELYARTSSILFGICMRMLRERAEAEEVLQETYTGIWRRAAGFDPARASALTWLVTLTRNKAIDRLRQHRDQRLDHPAALAEIEDEHPSPASAAEASQEYQRLERCLDALEPRQRQSVREAFFTGATYKVLADRMEVPPGTMKSWIRRSLIQLRTCLET